MNVVEEFYNTSYDEWSRLERHPIEFEITKRALKECLASNSEILDVGGGPGRYSIFLAEQGHKVTLLDLSDELVKQAQKNAAAAGVVLEETIKGNVLDLDRITAGKQYDAVLCMGPMYHLLLEEERKEALRQCLDRLKPGGIIIISFISAYAPIIDYLKSCPEEIVESKSRLLQYLKDGRNDKSFGFTDAYFINPDSIEAFTEGFNITKIRLIAAEGLGAFIEPALMQLPQDIFQQWIDLFYEISDKINIFGASAHLLYIGRKVD